MSTKAVTAAIGMGSNQGDRLAFMIAAARAFKNLPETKTAQLSPIYQSEAVDCQEPHSFFNAAALLVTKLTARSLLRHLHQIEDGLGRTRPYRNAPRPIDLDLLLFGSQVSQEANLFLPHPRMAERLFVLQPLADIWGEAFHPVCQRSISELTKERMAEEESGGVIRTSHAWPADLFA